jgi:hypothetical protein
MLADYKCDCGNVIEYKKPYGQENFPETIDCNCGKQAKRVYQTTIIVPTSFKSVHSK